MRYRITVNVVRACVLALVTTTACARGGAATMAIDGDHGGDDAPRQHDAPEGGSDAPQVQHDSPIDGNGLQATHLVINEVDYDQVSTDNAEFVEIFNPTGSAISLTSVALMLVNGSSTPGTVYATVDLSSKTSLPAGGYLVISGAGVTPAPGALSLHPTTPAWNQDAIQNGAPDGLALVDTGANTVIDAVSYEGSITSATLTGFSMSVSLVEGTATTVSDSNSVPGSLCRINGQDTDDAMTDWKYCTTTTPGAANP